MPVMNRATCNSQLTNPIIQGRVTNEHMCIGVATINPNICNVRKWGSQTVFTILFSSLIFQNNPGAGYYCNRQLVGMLSSGRQCNTANSPGLAIQPRFYIDWINRQLLREDNPGPGGVSPPETS